MKWYAMPIRTCDNWCDAEFCTFLIKHEINCFILYLFDIICNSNLKILFTFIYTMGWNDMPCLSGLVTIDVMQNSVFSLWNMKLTVSFYIYFT